MELASVTAVVNADIPSSPTTIIFEIFLKDAIKENPMKCEHVIPTAIGDLVRDKVCKLKMLSSEDQWFGVTYQEDKPLVVEKIQAMKDAGVYPDVLWD